MKENRTIWSERQAMLASEALQYRKDFPAVAERWERWWGFDADRPLVVGSVALDSSSPALKMGKAFGLLDSPEKWLEVREAQVTELYWIDSTVPSVRADIGPVCIGAFLGAPLGLAVETDTSWQTPILNGDWDGEVPVLDESNKWLKKVLELADLVAYSGAGRYLVCLPDLSGAIDILANLRGTEPLLMDLYDRPDAVVEAAARINDSWERSFELIFDTITAAGNGITTWLGAWSSSPYILSTNDFNYMISESQFREFCLPSLVEQARRAGRCALHMDGPGAIKHMEALAETPEITVVQFTPGAGTPSALEWIETWEMLQEAGKPLALACPAEEVLALSSRLNPKGLLLLPQGVETVADAKELESIVQGV